uniref:NADH-ubiquinone oxidoreductase chain 6 n=1 Tax=Psychopsis coelivaga TaxID=1821760 RepID=A0A1S5QYI5_9NEOP|nr:NADH dehydrogenase subunit 6 [Psychopsis coelivaga]
MIQFIMMMSLFFSINFILTSHPLTMGLNMLIQTLLISLICGYLTPSFWFSYILFLIMLGGMLVLFIYVTSLASNELFSFSTNLMIIMSLMFLLATIMFMYSDSFFIIYNNLEMLYLNYSSNFMNFENEINLIKLYNNPTMNITMMMINYLFLTLIIIVKITNINHGSLRQTN